MDFAASVQAVGLRVTKLDAAGAPLVGASNSFVTKAFTKFGWTPEYEEGQEVKTIAGDGSICIYYKAPDAFKEVKFQFEICNPQPELTAILAGGSLLSSSSATTAITNKALTANIATLTSTAHGLVTGDSIVVAGVDAVFNGSYVVTTYTANTFSYARINVDVISAAATGTVYKLMTGTGWAAPLLGEVATPNGVAIEVWSRAIIGGRPAAVNPFWRWVIPSAQVKMDGERVLENGAMANVFSGTGLGNAGFGDGPGSDWLFPSTSAIVYARDAAAATAEGYFAVV